MEQPDSSPSTSATGNDAGPSNSGPASSSDPANVSPSITPHSPSAAAPAQSSVPSALPSATNLDPGSASNAPVTTPDAKELPPGVESVLSEIETSFGHVTLASTSAAADEVDEDTAHHTPVTSRPSSDTTVAPLNSPGTPHPAASTPSLGLVDAIGAELARAVLSHLSAHDIVTLLKVCKEDNRHINTFIRETPLSLKMHMAFCNVSPPDLTSFSSEFRNALTTMGERSLKAELDDLLATQDSLMLASLPSIDVIPTPRSKLLGVAHGFAVVAHNLTGSPAATDFPSEWPYDVNDVNAISVIQLPGAGRLDKSPFGPNAKIVNGMWTWRWKLQESLRVLRAESTASICIEDNLMAIACRRASDIALAFFPILPHMEDGPDGKWPEYDSGLPLHPLAWDPTRSLFPYDLSWTALPTFIIKVAQDSTIGVLVNVRVAPMEDDVLPPILTLYFEVFDWKSGLLKGGLAPGLGLRVLDFDFLEHDNIIMVTHSSLARDNESPLRLEVWSPPAANFQVHRQPAGNEVFFLVNGSVNHTICLVPVVGFELETSSSNCIGREGLRQVGIESASLETQVRHRGEAVGMISVRVIIGDLENHQRVFFKMSVVNKVVRDVRQARDSALGTHLKFDTPNPYFRPGDPADQAWMSSVYDLMVKIWDTRTVPWSAFEPFVTFYQGGYGTSSSVNGTWSLHLQQAIGGSTPILRLCTYNEHLNGLQRVDKRTNDNPTTEEPRYRQDNLPDWLRLSPLPPAYVQVRDKPPRTPLSGNDDWHTFISNQFSPLSFLGFEMTLPPDPNGIESTIVKFDGKHAVIVREEAWDQDFLNAWATGSIPVPQDPAEGSILIVIFGASELAYEGKGKGKAAA